MFCIYPAYKRDSCRGGENWCNTCPLLSARLEEITIQRCCTTCKWHVCTNDARKICRNRGLVTQARHDESSSVGSSFGGRGRRNRRNHSRLKQGRPLLGEPDFFFLGNLTTDRDVGVAKMYAAALYHRRPAPGSRRARSSIFCFCHCRPRRQRHRSPHHRRSAKLAADATAPISSPSPIREAGRRCHRPQPRNQEIGHRREPAISLPPPICGAGTLLPESPNATRRCLLLYNPRMDWIRLRG
jgi:hypothetical protein